GAYVNSKSMTTQSTVENPHWRATSVSAKGIAETCESVEMQCVSQELVNWGGSRLSDCLSVIVRANSAWARENVVIENSEFMREAHHVSKVSMPYVHKLSVALFDK